jgi:type IV/VI secretion system ImpK/VasF family protein
MSNTFYAPTAPPSAARTDQVQTAAYSQQERLIISRGATTQQERRLAQLCEPMLRSILSLELPERTGDAAALYEQMQAQYIALRHDAAAAGLDAREIELAAFALVAFADETIAESDWIDRTQWPFLQYDYFQTRRAGEQFFDHLQQIQGRGYDYAIWKDAAKAELLEIYYLCLLLGFRGAWAFSPPSHIQHELEQIQRHVRARPVGPFSPNVGGRPYRHGAQGTASAWMWLAIAIQLTLIAGLALIYLP